MIPSNPPPVVSPKQPPSKFQRLALAMAAFGVLVGIIFPPFARWALQTEAAYNPLFVAACVAAGIVVAVVNFALVHTVLGTHIRVLANAMDKVNTKVASASGSGPVCGQGCRIPITSSDALGDVERAFNSMADSIARRIHVERAAGEMLAAAAASAELDVVARAILDGLMTPLDSHAGMLFSITGNHGYFLALRGFDSPEDIPTLRLSDGPVADAVRNTRSVLLDPDAAGLQWATLSTPFGAMRPKTVALIPLTAEQRTVALAVVAVASREDYETLLPVIEGCRLRAGPQLLNAVLHKKLQEMAAMDELTGVLNRRFGMKRLDEEYARAVRHGTPLAVFLLDIDHFKRFNDTFGHDAGDEVLRAVARTLEQSVRSSDLVCRYGGEEFLVLAPGAGSQDGAQLAERLRRHIETTTVSWKSKTLTVQASFGVASWPTVRASVASDIVTHADEALYAAKKGGRNRVYVYEGGKGKPMDPNPSIRPLGESSAAPGQSGMP